MPRLPDYRIVGKELTFVFPSNGDALVGYRMISDAVDAAEKERATVQEADFLEVAIEYFDRKGNVWMVTRHQPGYPCPYQAQTVLPSGRTVEDWFCADGRYYRPFERHYDLIKRVAPPPTPCPYEECHHFAQPSVKGCGCRQEG